jgi:hypothetical protein
LDNQPVRQLKNAVGGALYYCHYIHYMHS